MIQQVAPITFKTKLIDASPRNALHEIHSSIKMKVISSYYKSICLLIK